MEQNYSAPVDKVFTLLTDARWLEARSHALGELRAGVKVRRAAGGVAITMTRRVKRDMPGLLAKVLATEADLVFEESWSADLDGGRTGTLRMDVIGQPVTMSATFMLRPAGKGCVYRITHKCKSSVPLIGGAVEKFALGQVESGCADEFAYLVEYLKKNR